MHHAVYTILDSESTGDPSMMLSDDAIVAIASVSSITLCASSSVLFVVIIVTVALVRIKLKSYNETATAHTDSTIEHEINEPSPVHVYEAIAPRTMISSQELMNKNIAYGPIILL